MAYEDIEEYYKLIAGLALVGLAGAILYFQSNAGETPQQAVKKGSEKKPSLSSLLDEPEQNIVEKENTITQYAQLQLKKTLVEDISGGRVKTNQPENSAPIPVSELFAKESDEDLISGLEKNTASIIANEMAKQKKGPNPLEKLSERLDKQVQVEESEGFDLEQYYPEDQPYVVVEKNASSSKAPFSELDKESKERSPEEISHAELITALLKQLASQDEAEHIWAGINLRKEARARDVDLIVQELRVGHPTSIQKFLVETLGEIGDPRALPALFNEFKYGDINVIKSAIKAMGDIGAPESIPRLVKIMDANIPVELRAEAILSLGKLDAQMVLPRFKKLKGKRGPLSSAVVHASSFMKAKRTGKTTDKKFLTGVEQKLKFKDIPYRFYYPKDPLMDNSRPDLLVCMGEDFTYAKRKKSTSQMYNFCIKQAKQHSMALIVPEFDKFLFPGWQFFNLRDKRTDKLLDELIAHVSTQVRIREDSYVFFGAGEGADFLLRYTMVYPEKVFRAALIEPILLNLSNPKYLFPIGLGLTPFAPELRLKITEFLDRDVLIIGYRFLLGDGIKKTGNPSAFLDPLEKHVLAKSIRPRLRFKKDPLEGKGKRSNKKKRSWRAHIPEVERFLFTSAPQILR